MKSDSSNNRFPFVVFEGGDGSGKTSLRMHLFSRLSAAGHMPVSTIPVSWLDCKATEIITKAKYFDYRFPKSRILDAYVKDKEALTKRLIDPHLPFRPVVCDRFILSDTVYHELLFSISSFDVAAAYQKSTVRQPDLIVFVDTPPEIAVARLGNRATSRRHAWETLEKQQRVYSSFHSALRDNWLNLTSTVIHLDNSRDLSCTLRSFDAHILPAILKLC